MKIEIDNDADAMYIEFRKGKFFKNRKIDSNTIIDLDRNGNLLGIELLSIKQRIPLPSLEEFSVKHLGHSAIKQTA